MAIRLTDNGIKELPSPLAGNRVTYDDQVQGFGVRVTSSGARSFVLNYRAAGIERRLTIGRVGTWTVSAARKRAAELRQAVDRGQDPMGERHAERAAPTIAVLVARYREEHLPRKRASSAKADEWMLTRFVLPKLGRIKVDAIRRADIEKVIRDYGATAPIQANRLLALISKLMALAVRWEMRASNPAIGIERNPENKRERFLSPAELGRLVEAVAAHRNRTSARAISLLLLTGARRGEVLAATWNQFDLDAGVWTKPASTTKQKKLHRVPLSAPALALLVEMRATTTGLVLFPGRGANIVQAELKRSWASICKAARVEGLNLHDLRHSYASFLASAGLSLPIIGQLLGHSNPTTTHRYAHLLDDPLRAATERVGALVTAASRPAAEIVQMRKA